VSGNVDPAEFIITRKRKKYRFALFANSPLCYEAEQWKDEPRANILEIGAGTGLFGVALAKNMPNKQIVACDVKADRLQTGAKLADEENLSNVRFLRGRADLLQDFFAASTLDAIWITFPDPFPKDRSSKHRLTHPRFLEIYRKLLKADGELYFKTDATNLFQWSLEQLVGQGWQLEELSFDLHDSDLDNTYKMMTTYEKRFVSEGLPIHFVKASPPQK
jgi:tRNA (guanine-N7-)-methyltransferase